MQSTNNSILRPACVAGVAVAIDKFYFGENNLQSNAIFGASVASGVYLSEIVAPMIPNMPSPNGDLVNGKMLMDRVAEVGSSILIGYSVNRFLLRNDKYASDEMYERLGTILVADVAGTYLAEYINGQPLGYLTH